MIAQHFKTFGGLRPVTSATPQKKHKPFPSLPDNLVVKENRNACTCSECHPALYEAFRHPIDVIPYRPNTKLQIWAHSSYYLAQIAADSFSPHAHLMWGQLHARFLWSQFWLKSSEYKLLKTTNDLSTLDIAHVLRKPLEIFNQLFFLGQLPARLVSIKWFGKGEALGTQGQANTSATEAWIYLNPHHYRHRHDPTFILRTLLHELIHAFLALFTCQPDLQLCPFAACHSLNPDDYGHTGHGRAWQILAHAIEFHGPKHLPGFDIWLGRHEAVIQEIAKLGWRPSECDIRKLFEKDEAVVRVLTWLGWRGRDDDGVFDGRLQKWAHGVQGKLGRRGSVKRVRSVIGIGRASGEVV